MNTFLNPNAIADGSITAPKLEGGEYPKITSGFAKDLTGRIEATPEEFTYRPSAGDKSVRDESAVIRRIKGNTSVWGQGLNLALDQTGDNGWWFRNPEGGGNVRIEGNTVKYDVIPDKGQNQQISQKVGTFTVGHIYLLHFTFNNNGAINEKWKRPWVAYFATNLYGNGEVVYAPQDGSTSGVANIFHKVDTEGLQYIILKQTYIGISNSEITPTVMEFGDIQIFDVTDLFDAGNEPTTYEEFRKYYPDTYYPYCAPEVRSMRATGIETIGFNAYNGEYAEVIGGQTYYLGGTIDTAHFATEIGGDSVEITIPENRLYTPSENGYIYATGSDICINLSHSGVRNGEYKPYEKNTLLLPEIAKYFPDGMHGIGDVCDEINEEMAIQRCAVRAYEEGDENNAEVKTDKITTVYKLSEPIYTPIDEPLQLDYKVDDFGTERMLSNAPSAPFKADITYGFNAEGRIRDNSRNIERLENNIIDIRDGADKGKTSVQSITINGESKTPDENGVVDLGNIYVTTLAYTATSKIENTEYPWDKEEGEYTFGVPIIRHEYDEPTGVGVIYFNGRITIIGDSAFGNCANLTSVTIPDSVTTIGIAAFAYCDNLTSVTIPDSVTYIGNGAFESCDSLTSVTIGDSVTAIGNEAFYGCSSLTSVTIPDSVTTIGGNAFRSCSSLTSVTIGDSVTSIGQYAFRGCTGELVVNCNIPFLAFYGSKFTSVTIGDSVTEIGIQAFYNCIDLTSVTIPDSVTTIRNEAFYGCSSLTSVYCKAVTPPTGGSNMFYSNAPGRKIYVPMESVDAYKSATGWSDYADDIVGYRFNANFNDYYTKSETDDIIEGAIVTESTVSGWGFTKNTGTITGVSANGTSIATSGVANIPAASISNYGVTKLSSLTNSTSTILAATPKAVKSAYDLANGKYSKPADGIPSTDLSESVNEALSLAQSAIQKSDIEYAVVASFTIDDINTSTLNNIDIERTDEGNFKNSKPLMIKKNANSDALYPLTYARIGDLNSMNRSYICTCTVEDMTYEFEIFYISAQTQKGKILNIHKYGDCYVVDFTLENLNTIATSQIEINVTKLYDVIRNHQPIIIKNLTADYGGVLVSGWIENLDDGETAHINLNIPTSTGFWNINGLVFDKTNQEQQTYTMTRSNVTKYSLPRLSSGSEDYLIAKNNLKTINNTNIYINSSTEPTNIYTYYPEIIVQVIGTVDSPASYNLYPNAFYNWGDNIPINIKITFSTTTYENVINEYIFQFKTTDTVPTVEFPSAVKWVSGDAPVLEENKIYQISIINNLGTVLSWDNA